MSKPKSKGIYVSRIKSMKKKAYLKGQNGKFWAFLIGIMVGAVATLMGEMTVLIF